MMYGQPLFTTPALDSGLDDRFWYWHGASGQRYIHSIYRRDLCPFVAGAVFVVVSVRGGLREAQSVGRFPALNPGDMLFPIVGSMENEEIHVHLLTWEEEGAASVMRDLLAALSPAAAVPHNSEKSVQIELLAA
jgi:hypothetical protein